LGSSESSTLPRTARLNYSVLGTNLSRATRRLESSPERSVDTSIALKSGLEEQKSIRCIATKTHLSIGSHGTDMAEEITAPYAPQDVQEVATLIRGLEASSGKNNKGKKSFSCKKSTFPVAGTNDITVDSWRFQDWDYKRRDLPTYARGLFTTHTRQGRSEIVIRGYDKFFNVEEVHETKWQNVLNRTKGPYELSVKENGCIIFISGLEDETLLVCSKHSTGVRQDSDVSHAVAGERWVDKHLAAIGKTKQDLARELRKRNATAVAELCDDTFEEHVLAYDQKSAGLYLHGINLNLPEFATYPGPLVHKFADEWGFKKAEFLVKDDINAVKIFLDGCAETGSWNGRDTEGFVIRCQARVGGDEGAFHDWFFKYKFEEPYLMYRQWREVTKSAIAGKAPRYKKHKNITEDYLLYARRQLAQNPGLGKAFNANHGIIAMRDGFLKERGLKGSDIIRQEHAEGGSQSNEVTNHVVLAPVASIGCGKTTVAFALTKLFNWGHVQNDNITGRKNRPLQFATQVCNSLASHPVMIADRNNHQKRERKQIIEDVQKIIPDARFVALHYVHDPKDKMLPNIRKVTRDRVLTRGDNHQTIQAGTKSQQEIIGIMDGFLDRFEPVDTHTSPDDGFDEVINLDVAASSRENLETVVSSLHSAYPKLFTEMPTSSDLDDAIDAALKDYQPDIKHDLSFSSNKKKPNPSSNGTHPSSSQPHKTPRIDYFCIHLPTTKILSTLSTIFDPLDAQTAKFYRHLHQSRRIQPSFHVTLIHRASSAQHPELWQRYTDMHIAALSALKNNNNSNSNSNSQNHPSDAEPDPVLGTCKVQLERVVWDERVMCLVARLLPPSTTNTTTTTPQTQTQNTAQTWESTNAITHLTIGTASSAIKPKESNDLLQRWLSVGSGAESGIGERGVGGFVVVEGWVGGVGRRFV